MMYKLAIMWRHLVNENKQILVVAVVSELNEC